MVKAFFISVAIFLVFCSIIAGGVFLKIHYPLALMSIIGTVIFILIFTWVETEICWRSKRKRKKKKGITLKVGVDKTDVDKAINRVDELMKKIKEAKAIVQALASELQNIELQVNVKR